MYQVYTYIEEECLGLGFTSVTTVTRQAQALDTYPQQMTEV